MNLSSTSTSSWLSRLPPMWVSPCDAKDARAVGGRGLVGKPSRDILDSNAADSRPEPSFVARKSSRRGDADARILIFAREPRRGSRLGASGRRSDWAERVARRVKISRSATRQRRSIIRDSMTNTRVSRDLATVNLDAPRAVASPTKRYNSSSS